MYFFNSGRERFVFLIGVDLEYNEVFSTQNTLEIWRKWEDLWLCASHSGEEEESRDLFRKTEEEG